MVQTRQITPPAKRRQQTSSSNESRPKRSVSVKNYNEEEEHGIHWREETELNKALYASLQYSQLETTTEDASLMASQATSSTDSTKDRASVSSSSTSNGNKVHAQRKFAQNSVYPFTPETSPHKARASMTVPRNIPSRPKTEDFLTFLCLRGTPALPRHLNFFNYPGSAQLSMLDRGNRSPESSSSSDTEIWDHDRRTDKNETSTRKTNATARKTAKLSGKPKSKSRYNEAATRALKRGKIVANQQQQQGRQKNTAKAVGKSVTRKLPPASRLPRSPLKRHKHVKERGRTLRSHITNKSGEREKPNRDSKLLTKSCVPVKSIKVNSRVSSKFPKKPKSKNNSVKSSKNPMLSSVKCSSALVRKIKEKSIKTSPSSRLSRYLKREKLSRMDSIIDDVAYNPKAGHSSRAKMPHKTFKKNIGDQVIGRPLVKGLNKNNRCSLVSDGKEVTKTNVLSNESEIKEEPLHDLISEKSGLLLDKNIRNASLLELTKSCNVSGGKLINEKGMRREGKRIKTSDSVVEKGAKEIIEQDKEKKPLIISKEDTEEETSSSTDIDNSPNRSSDNVRRTRSLGKTPVKLSPERVSTRPVRQVRKNIRYRMSDDESDFIDLDLVDLDDLDTILIRNSTSKVGSASARENAQECRMNDTKNIRRMPDSSMCSEKLYDAEDSGSTKKVTRSPAGSSAQLIKPSCTDAKPVFRRSSATPKHIKNHASPSSIRSKHLTSAISDTALAMKSFSSDHRSQQAVLSPKALQKPPQRKNQRKEAKLLSSSAHVDTQPSNNSQRMKSASSQADSSDIEAESALVRLRHKSCPPAEKTLDNVKALRQNTKPISFYSENIQAPLIISPKKKSPKFLITGTPEKPRSSDHFPPPGDGGHLLEVPVFHPTSQQFHDPLEYIASIRQQAEPFGMCRVIPPDSWKPESRVSEDMRFTSQFQYIHKMHKRWGPNSQKMSCIRKHLASVSVHMEHPPMIGGIEVDLPKLYQTIQSYGGLKNVTEKKTIIKVADAMRIPKSALERGTKLYDIYCQYLLSYDTLSEENKQRLEHQVLSDRLRKNRNQEEEEDSVIKVTDLREKIEELEMLGSSYNGRSMNISTFNRLARNTQSIWFKDSVEPSPEQVETEYWQLVNERTNHVMVQCAHVDTAAHGSAFPSRKDSPFSRHGWNFNILSQNPMSILRCLGPVSGVTIPTLHIGMLFTSSCWSTDHHFIPYIHYLHTGANLIWYCVPESEEQKLQTVMRDLVPDLVYEGDSWLPEDTVMISPEVLRERGVSLCRCVQTQGEFIVVFTKCYTATISCGYNVSESVHFAYSDWLPYAVNASEMLYKCCEAQLFSIHRLLCTLAEQHRDDTKLMRLILPHLKHYINEELSLRAQVSACGLKPSPRSMLKDEPQSAGVVPVNGGSKKRRSSDVATREPYVCDISKAICYFSVVLNEADNGVYSIEQALVCRHRHLKSYKLLYRYSQAELLGLLNSVQDAINNAAQTSTNVSPASETHTRRQLRK